MAARTTSSRKKTSRKKKKSTKKSPKLLSALGLGVKKKKALVSKSPHLGEVTVSEFNELQLVAAKVLLSKKKKPGLAGACGVCCSCTP